MKIFSAHQIKELDELTCTRQKLTPLGLMERASAKVYHYLMAELESDYFVVFVGMGDNGGDGLAVARMLLERGIAVTVVVVQYRERFSPSAEFNFQRYIALGGIYHLISQGTDLSFIDQLINEKSTVLDAIFGVGLHGKLDLFTRSVVEKINGLRSKSKMVIGLDMPSGILFEHHDSDMPLQDEPENNLKLPQLVVLCDVLLTFQMPKLPLLFPENGLFFEKMVILDIGLEVEEYCKNMVSDSARFEDSCFFDNQLAFRFPLRRRVAHKGSCGHALMVAGSYGKMGAAVLATKAMLAAGVGLATAHVPRCGYEILQVAIPDAMVHVDGNERLIMLLGTNLELYNAIAFGPGTGAMPETAEALKQLLKELKSIVEKGKEISLVLDADAINILAENPMLLPLLPIHKTVLTPHFKELERLIGVSVNDTHYHRLTKTREFCLRHGVVVVVKGAYSAIVTDKGEIHFNSTGNQGLATAGSGDVLTGIITAFLANGLSAATAAIWGCYLHGLAADIMANEMGYESITAVKLIDYLGIAFKMSEELRK